MASARLSHDVPIFVVVSIKHKGHNDDNHQVVFWILVIILKTLTSS